MTWKGLTPPPRKKSSLNRQFVLNDPNSIQSVSNLSNAWPWFIWTWRARNHESRHFFWKKKHLYDIYMLFRMSSASSCDKMSGSWFASDSTCSSSLRVPKKKSAKSKDTLFDFFKLKVTYRIVQKRAMFGGTWVPWKWRSWSDFFCGSP